MVPPSSEDGSSIAVVTHVSQVDAETAERAWNNDVTVACFFAELGNEKIPKLELEKRSSFELILNLMRIAGTWWELLELGITRLLNLSSQKLLNLSSQN